MYGPAEHLFLSCLEINPQAGGDCLSEKGMCKEVGKEMETRHSLQEI